MYQLDITNTPTLLSPKEVFIPALHTDEVLDEIEIHYVAGLLSFFPHSLCYTHCRLWLMTRNNFGRNCELNYCCVLYIFFFLLLR